MPKAELDTFTEVLRKIRVKRPSRSRLTVIAFVMLVLRLGKFYIYAAEDLFEVEVPERRILSV